MATEGEGGGAATQGTTNLMVMSMEVTNSLRIIPNNSTWDLWCRNSLEPDEFDLEMYFTT